MSVLSGQFPSSCLMGFTVFMNIAAVIFSITGVVLYAVDLGDASLLWICNRIHDDADLYDDSCKNVALFDQNLLTSMDNMLTSLTLLLLFASMFLAVLGISFLAGGMKKEDLQSLDDS